MNPSTPKTEPPPSTQLRKAVSRGSLQHVALMIGLVVAAAQAVGGEDKPHVVADRFEDGAAGWQVYDYNGGSGTSNVFYPVTWEKKGGVGDSGYIWGDDSRWRIDTPEKPNSILAFIIYRSWVKGDQSDLRNAEMSVHLRGDKLDLKGAKCLFWVFNHRLGTRWHFTAHPLAVHEGAWGEKQTIVLKNDPALWHRSWSRHPDAPGSLNDVLGATDSYGFAFVGFSEEVTGRFAMDELVFQLKDRTSP